MTQEIGLMTLKLLTNEVFIGANQICPMCDTNNFVQYFFLNEGTFGELVPTHLINFVQNYLHHIVRNPNLDQLKNINNFFLMNSP